MKKRAWILHAVVVLLIPGIFVSLMGVSGLTRLIVQWLYTHKQSGSFEILFFIGLLSLSWGIFSLYRWSAIQRENLQLMNQAYLDELTGVYNRRGFYYHAKLEEESAVKKDTPFSVLFIDLDRFKWVNDEFGHTVGDELLKNIAKRLSHGLRKGSLVSRLGGDEFAIMLPNSSREEAVSVRSRVSESMKRPFSIHGKDVEITASIGLAEYPSEGTDLEQLMENADKEMYRLKKEKQK